MVVGDTAKAPLLGVGVSQNVVELLMAAVPHRVPGWHASACPASSVYVPFGTSDVTGRLRVDGG